MSRLKMRNCVPAVALVVAPACTLDPLPTFGQTCNVEAGCDEGFTCTSVEGADEPTSICMPTADAAPVVDPCADAVSVGDLEATSDDDLAQLDGVGAIRGSLRMGGGVSDAGLVHLAQLQCVDGTLHVAGTRIETLTLPALQEVTGALRIGAVDFTDLSSGFPAVFGNPSLVRVSLPALREVGGRLDIADDDALRAVSIATADTPAAITGSLVVWDNASLDGDGAPAGAFGGMHIARIGGCAVVADNVLQGTAARFAFPDLRVVGHDAPGECDVIGAAFGEIGLPDLVPPGSFFFGSLRANAAEVPSTLSAPALETVDGSLTLHGFGVAAPELPQLREVGALDISETDAFLPAFEARSLATVSGLPAQATSISVRFFRTATSTIAMPALQHISGSLELKDGRLTDLCGLARLTSVSGDLILDEIPSLASVAGLGGPDVLDVGGTVQITNNASLPQCQVDALVAQCTPSSASTSGNAATGACAIPDDATCGP